MVSVELGCDVFLYFFVELLNLWLVGHLPSPKHDIEVFICPLEELEEVRTCSALTEQNSQRFQNKCVRLDWRWTVRCWRHLQGLRDTSESTLMNMQSKVLEDVVGALHA